MGHAGFFGDDRDGIGVPGAKRITLLDPGAFVGHQPGAILNLVNGPLAAFFVLEHNFKVTAHDHQAALAVGNHIAVSDADRGIEFRFDRGSFADRRRAANVEGPHGQLVARLADRLGSNHADRFTDVDRRPTGQIAAVTFAADAASGFAGQDRTDKDRGDPRRLDGVRFDLI